MPNALIVGASSGIGRALAAELADEYELGLAARRTERLRAVAESVGGAHVAEIDVVAEDARDRFDDVVDALGGVDLVVLSAGVGRHNPELAWPPERDTVAVNVHGFAAIATAAIRQFEATGGGHLVGISSLAAEIGDPAMPAYPASKAFASRYLESLRYRYPTDDVAITDVRPGYVDTPMSPDVDRFWECSAETAARGIARAIRREHTVAYVPRRWWLVSKLLAVLPDRYRARLV